jgi:hypothetical protein
MASDAMSFSCVQRGGGDTAHYVLFVSDSFQMIRVIAGVISTKMVNHHPATQISATEHDS